MMLQRTAALRARRGGGGQAAAIIAVLAFVALLTGLAIAVLPLQLTALLTGLFLLLVALAVVAVAPPMQRVPAAALSWGLVIAIAFYFIWPRNVFLPVTGLPVKHPQRLFYLLFLAYAAYVFFKCAPARAQLMQALRAVPWLSALWLAFALWQLVSLFTAKHSLALVGGWFVETLVVTLLYPVALMCLTTVRDYHRLFAALLLAAVFNALLTLPETLLQRNLFEQFIALDKLDPETAKQIIAAKVRGGRFRAQGTFDHPLLLAEFLVVCLPIAIALLFQKGRRLLGAACIGVLVVGLYLSHSRTAVVAGVVAVSAMVVAMIVRGAGQGRRNPWPLVAALFAMPLVMAAGIVATTFIRTAISGTTYVESSSTDVRWQMLREGAKLIAKEPILGYGPGTAGYVLNFQNTFGVMTLDNYLLALTLDFGLPGLVLYLLVVVITAWGVLALAVKSLDGNIQSIAWAVFGSICAFGAIKLVLGTPLNNLLLPIWMAGLATVLLATMNRATPRSTPGMRN